MSNHPNQWFLDICPAHFSDKDYFFENVLFRGLIHFWEDDDGEENTRSQISIDRFEYGMTVVDHLRHVEFYQDMYSALSEAYNFAKEWVNTQFVDEADYEQATKHLQNIIKYRGKMWT